MLKRFKKVTSVFLLISMLFISISGCSSKSSSSSTSATGEEKVLNLYTWAGYVPDDVIKQFEKQTGIKVNFSNFSTNEEMLAKLQANKGSQYDVIICADYMVQLMAKQKDVLMQPINKSNISNYKNIEASALNQYYDKGNKYSIPYTLGAEMIVYDPSKVKTDVKSVKDLWDPSLKGSEVVLDDPRSIIGVALTKLGYDINTTDQAKLNEAKEQLKTLKPNIKVFDADTPHKSLISGDTTIGLMWGSQASSALRGKTGLKIVYPEEGMQMEEDNFIIPVKAPHSKNAEKFINFMLDGKISNQTTAEIEYINVNTAAKQYMSKEFINNKAVNVPQEEYTKAKHTVDVGGATKQYDTIWSEFKQQ